MKRRRIKMLYLVREMFPTFRPDVRNLFGEEMLRRGHEIDFVMQASHESLGSGPREWNGRTVWLTRNCSGRSLYSRLWRHWLALSGDVMALRLLVGGQYDALQVKDKYIVPAVLAVYFKVMARRSHLQFYYWLSWPESESQVYQAQIGAARYPWLARMRGKTTGWLLYRIILPSARHVFCQSVQMAMDICDQGVPSAKVSVVPMGFDFNEDQLEVKRSYAIDGSEEVCIGYLGTLAAERRITVLVDALALLRSQGLGARLMLVGDAERAFDREQIMNRARTLGLERFVTITGFLPRSDALKKVLEADICVSPFYPTPILQSTSPTKLVEYLALGLPVVANTHPEQRSILRASKSGVCVPWGAKHFARGIAWMAARSPEERRAMAERGKTWVAAHRSYRKIADELEATYMKILNDDQPSIGSRV